MDSPEYEYSSSETKTTPLDVIAELKNEGYIPDQSPFWWGTDYKYDPRVYLDHEDFTERIVKIEPPEGCPYYLYPHPEVPMTSITLDVQGKSMSFLVTARPFHPKELNYQPRSCLTDPVLQNYKTTDNLKANITEVAETPRFHFMPHIRGLLSGVRNNNYFWYPVPYEFYEKIIPFLRSSRYAYLSDMDEFRWEEESLGVGNGSGGSRSQLTYRCVYEELEKVSHFKTNKLLIPDSKLTDMFTFRDSTYDGPERHLKNHSYGRNFGYRNQLQLEEFLQISKREKNLNLLYPININGIEHTLPLFIANRDLDSDKIRAPLVYGIPIRLAHVGKAGIVRIVDPLIAEFISSKLSRDFGVEVRTLLYKPKKGKSSYEIVPGKPIENTYQPPIIFPRRHLPDNAINMAFASDDDYFDYRYKRAR
jgi:hypothetical protein